MKTIKNKRNPILPINIHIPDPEAHVMPDGKLYIYGSYDGRDDVFCSEKYHVISTEDMETWNIHPVSLRGDSIPWFNNPEFPKYPGIDWSKPTPFIQKMLANKDMNAEKEKFEQPDNNDKPKLLFAPDAIHKEGKYYLYFCMSDDSEGVAVSDFPEGPFENPIQLPIGGIDPAIFIDDDGQAYYYWGQLYSYGVPLNKDMVSLDRNKIVNNIVTEEEHFFHEGASMRKIGNLYYLVYSNMERGKPTSLGYSTSSSPLGPFTYQGIIIDNENCDPASWNNHGSIENVDGQWYVFYHRCSRGEQLYRRLCIEPIEITSDGSISEVEMTSQGLGKPFSLNEEIFAYHTCEVHGALYLDIDDDYGEKLTNIQPSDSAIFRYVFSDIGFNKISLSAYGSGQIEILFDDKLAGTIEIKDGIQQNSNIKMAGGEYELTLKVIKENDLEILKMKLY